MISEIAKWVLIGMSAFGVIMLARNIGKPREPITAETFAFVLVWNILEVVSILIFWGP